MLQGRGVAPALRGTLCEPAEGLAHEGALWAVHLVVWQEAPYAEPLCLVTSLEPAEEAIYYYGFRFRIETFFPCATTWSITKYSVANESLSE